MADNHTAEICCMLHQAMRRILSLVVFVPIVSLAFGSVDIFDKDLDGNECVHEEFSGK